MLTQFSDKFYWGHTQVHGIPNYSSRLTRRNDSHWTHKISIDVNQMSMVLKINKCVLDGVGSSHIRETTEFSHSTNNKWPNFMSVLCIKKHMHYRLRGKQPWYFFISIWWCRVNVGVSYRHPCMVFSFGTS